MTTLGDPQYESRYSDGLERCDQRSLIFPVNAILCFACVRNEALRLPYFIEYHRHLGINRFLIVDNGSRDGTLEFLMGQHDIHVFRTGESYASANYGMAWLNALLATYGVGHWCLTLDADELLIYPHSESLDLRRLTRYLEWHQSNGLKTFMLDMYADKPILQTVYSAGTSLLTACPYFDADTYHEVGKDGVPIRGGPRHRLFWQGRAMQKPSPVLKKIPLVKWRKELHYAASTHAISDVKLSQLTGALMHFKLLSDFYESASREVDRKEHWDGAAQYKAYRDGLEEATNISAIGSHSRKYSDSIQLVALGLMQMPPDFELFRQQRQDPRIPGDHSL